MSKYTDDYVEDFRKDLKKIKAHFDLRKRLESKIDEILRNPHHYKSLRNVLKNKRRAHIGSYVLVFEIDETQKVITFHSLMHHDGAYK
ncbi:MAG: type II toxin-antitoxin system RelE/ParE family toxin [Deltaproteobacteria bacterium]|nr:type II toxin-antitoxin system RelE/ParE family toxin [Deltaproteobacteria bacterium]